MLEDIRILYLIIEYPQTREYSLLEPLIIRDHALRSLRRCSKRLNLGSEVRCCEDRRTPIPISNIVRDASKMATTFAESKSAIRQTGQQLQQHDNAVLYS